MDQAVAGGRTSQDEAVELELANLALKGITPDRNPAYVVVETSVRTEEDNATRALARTSILAKATGEPVPATVTSTVISPENARLAESIAVTFLEVPDR